MKVNNSGVECFLVLQMKLIFMFKITFETNVNYLKEL